MDSGLFLKETEDAKALFAVFSPGKKGTEKTSMLKKAEKTKKREHNWFDFLRLRQRPAQKRP